ncbi:hypothetical protein JSO62_10445 [Riemerella anatipestifer]
MIKNNDEEIDFFQPEYLGAFGSSTKLILFASFNECGEWGGHKEILEVYAKENQNFYAKYIKNRVDCSKIGELYGKPEFQKLDYEKELKLNKVQQKAIFEYLLKLTESKISENFPSHSGQIFGAEKTDSTFYIRVYDNSSKNLKNYNTLLTELNIENVKIDRE